MGRRELSRTLTEHMLSSAFVTLAALPLTPHGKLDRKALPAPDPSSVARGAREAPEGEVEKQIAHLAGAARSWRAWDGRTTPSSWAGIRCWWCN